eukprot:UN05271
MVLAFLRTYPYSFFPFNEIHRIHMVHHKIHYPFNNLLSKEYKDGGGQYAYGPLIIGLWVMFYQILPLDLYCILMVESFILIGP